MLDKAVRKGFHEMVTFKLKPEGKERSHPWGIGEVEGQNSWLRAWTWSLGEESRLGTDQATDL